MSLVDPDRVRLVPGESFQAMFAPSPDAPGQIGFFIRSHLGDDPRVWSRGIKQRGGLIRFDEVILVVTMIQVNQGSESLFDIWWDYHSAEGETRFRQMAQQERVTVHFYNDDGKRFSVDTENNFRKFFTDLLGLLTKTKPWTEVEFDRALRGFCAQSYPKENLWDMIEAGTVSRQTKAPSDVGIDDYPGIIPMELRPFYAYLGEKGHSIRIIPSILEDDAARGNPEDYLHPAPVKTVLRCGIRWTKGYPVAPIPFIPGHGLAVPPDDTEL